MPEENEMLNMCLKKGAHKAVVIDIDSIPFDEELRVYCEANQCGYFGKNYACPPHVGLIKDLIADAKCYKRALVFQTIGNLTDSYDFEGMEEAIKIHSEVANQIGEEIVMNFEKYLDLRAGPCKVCEQCSIIDNEPCQYSHQSGQFRQKNKLLRLIFYPCISLP